MGIDEVESKRKSWPGTNLVMTGEGARYSFLRTNALKPQAGSSSRDIQPVDTFDLLSVLICQHSLKGIDSSRAEGRNKCTLWIAAVELIESSVVFISIY